MCTYLKNIANYKHIRLKNKSFEEIQMLFDNAIKWIDSFVPMDSEVVEGSKSQAEGKKAELKLCLEIVPRDDEAINVESLATKYPIIFTAMLDDFDRQDVLDLYRLGKETFETTSLEGYDSKNDKADDDMGYDPSDVAFTEWLGSKIFNYKTMDHYTMKALWIYYFRGDDEVELTDEESSDDIDEVAETYCTKAIEDSRPMRLKGNDWIYDGTGRYPWVDEIANGLSLEVVGTQTHTV
ncbi:hypothetical protein Tco_1142506 [Tanacetum coccineum]